MAQPTQYDLSRAFWDFVFENPEKVKPTHIAVYFFAVEHCNRLGWKAKFGFPTSMVLDAVGIKSYNTYKQHFGDLVEWGFFTVIEYSRNQFSSNIISLSIALQKNDKALDKAIVKHTSKQPQKQDESTRQSTQQSAGSIDKPITNNQEPITTTTDEAEENRIVNVYANIESFAASAKKDQFFTGLIFQKGVELANIPKWLSAFNRRLIFTADTMKSEKEYRSHFANWLVKVPNYRTANPDEYDPIKDPEIKKVDPATAGMTPNEILLMNKLNRK